MCRHDISWKHARDHPGPGWAMLRRLGGNLGLPRATLEPLSRVQRRKHGAVQAAWNQGHVFCCFFFVEKMKKLVEFWLLDASARIWEIKTAKSLSNIQGVSRVCIDVVRRALNASWKDKLSAGEKALLRAVICQGCWTRSRAAVADWLLSTLQ